MTDISNLCMECLGTKNDSGVCPHCGKEEDITQISPLLPIKSVIAQRYLIAKARKINGEGITYAAYDMNTEKAVSVREFFPTGSAVRDIDLMSVLPKENAAEAYSQHLNSFISLWKKIMRLKGVTALITVNDVFRCNGTAYAVYDESESTTLRDYLLNTDEGFISWEQARILFMPVLSTLGTLHTSGVVHKGINPAAFIFTKDGKLKLTDFCTEHVRANGSLGDTELFDGYAPLEQYSASAKIDARTDIYSFCCVLYRSLIGSLPIDSRERAENDRMMIPARFAEQLPAYVINALINGMSIYPEDRTDNIEQLRSDLSASQRAIGASAPRYTPPKEPQKTPATENPFVDKLSAPAAPLNPPAKETVKAKAAAEERKKTSKKKNTQLTILCGILAILLGVIGFLLLTISNLQGDDKPEETTSSTTVVSVPYFVGAYIQDIIQNPAYTEYFIFKTVKEYRSDVQAGIVTDQSIPYNSTASKGDTIILTISQGPKNLPVPDVTGKTFEEAEMILLSQGLTCKKSLIHNDGTHPGNTVAETIPAANEIIAEGKEVTIVVYTSLEEETSAENTQNTGGNAVQEFLEGLMTNPAPQQ